MENIFDTRDTEDTLQKNTRAEHSKVAQFVENILDLEETEDTQEKITCYPNFVHFVAFFSTFLNFPQISFTFLNLSQLFSMLLNMWWNIESKKVLVTIVMTI